MANGLRIRQQNTSESRQDDLTKRMSVGGLAPGIKFRKKEELMNEVEQRDIVMESGDRADPFIYAHQGGLMKFLKERLLTFMRNDAEVNIMISSILVRLCSFPVKLDTLDG